MPNSTSIRENQTQGRIGCVLRRITAVFALLTLAACATSQPGAAINDPYEGANRQIHAFNKGLDRAILRPAGQIAAATPVEVTGPITNFADNVGLPNMIVNGLLQGDIGGTATNTIRFVLNTTVGIGGLFDPAGAIGLDEQSTDFGETLAVWGVGEGAYIEMPVFGPSTQRDAVGTVVDLILDPLNAVGTAKQLQYGTATRAADLAIRRGQLFDTIDSVLYESADSYAQTRLVYLQNRRFELGEDQPATEEIDPFAGDLSLEGFE